MEEINRGDVHGHIFKLIGDSFVAYEYVQGAATDLSNINPAFFEELVGYLHANSLEDIVGLEIRGHGAENMVEFDFGDCGTVMMKDKDTCHGGSIRTTGWAFNCDGGIVSFKGDQTHMKTTRLTHRVLINGKLAPDILALKAVLKRFDVIS